MRWGKGEQQDVVCPYCGEHHCVARKDGKFRCTQCKPNFSCKVGTFSPFRLILKFREDKSCAILVELYKGDAIALIISARIFSNACNVPKMRLLL